MSKSVADIALGAIGNDAWCLAYHAADLERHVAVLSTMPTFRTLAEANLENAETKLKQALETVRNVRATMRPAAKLRAAS